MYLYTYLYWVHGVLDSVKIPGILHVLWNQQWLVCCQSSHSGVTVGELCLLYVARYESNLRSFNAKLHSLKVESFATKNTYHCVSDCHTSRRIRLHMQLKPV